MGLLHCFSQRHQGSIRSNQQKIHSRWHGGNSWHRSQLLMHPGPPLPSSAAPAHTNGGNAGDANKRLPTAVRCVDGPGSRHSTQRCNPEASNGVAQTQSGDAIELGEAADHHQIGMIGHQGISDCSRATKGKSFIADHQRILLEQRLQGGTAPDTGGVVGLQIHSTDPAPGSGTLAGMLPPKQGGPLLAHGRRPTQSTP